MRTVDELRALGVRVAKTDDVHVDIENNTYGWHVIMRAGQPGITHDGDPVWNSVIAPIMVAATAPKLDAAVQQAYDDLQFEEL